MQPALSGPPPQHSLNEHEPQRWWGLLYLVFVFLPLLFVPDRHKLLLLSSLAACAVFMRPPPADCPRGLVAVDCG